MADRTIWRVTCKADISPIFLVVTFAWSWGFWALPLMLHHGIALPPGLAGYAGTGTVAAWGPLVGALVAAVVVDGSSGLTRLFKQALVFRIGWRWFLVVFLTFPLLIGAATLVPWMMGEPLRATEAMAQPFAIPIAFVVILFTGGPLQEEFGWRGTLLDPLQDRFGAFWASLAVGAVWAVWHLPLFLYPNETDPYYGRPFWGTVLTLMLISVLFTWVWNNTGRSLLAVMIFHAMFNLSHWVLPALGNDTAGLALFGLQALAVGAVVAIYGAQRLRG